MLSELITEEALVSHLGGYRPGGDPATYYPELWTWLVDVCGVSSVLDVGCGEGISLNQFATLGCDVLGIEGTAQKDHRIIQHDYSDGPLSLEGTWDLAWCCEFVEHVEERFVPNFLETFRAARLVMMTHAFPGQPGHHHVNCQEPEYWIRVLYDAGFSFERELTEAARRRTSSNLEYRIDEDGVRWPNHFLRSGLVFLRDD